MFGKKEKKEEKKEPTLLESVDIIVDESKKIKSVFVKMKEDLDNKNTDLEFKKEIIQSEIDSYLSAISKVEEEVKSNESVIKNIDKIIG